jgi:hypothetical protein
MTLFKLEAEIDYPQILAYGIYSSLNPNRFCYTLNDHLLLKLVRKEKDHFIRTKNGKVFFSSFEYVQKNSAESWFLVKNKRSTNVAEPQSNTLFETLENSVTWLQTKGKFDYLLWLEGEDGFKKWSKKIEQELKKLTFVEAFEPLTEKTKAKLIDKAST